MGKDLELMNSPVLWLGEQYGFTSKIEVSQCNATQYLHVNAFLIFFFFSRTHSKTFGWKDDTFFRSLYTKVYILFGLPFLLGII